jgi:hypothetical protein
VNFKMSCNQNKSFLDLFTLVSMIHNDYSTRLETNEKLK